MMTAARGCESARKNPRICSVLIVLDNAVRLKTRMVGNRSAASPDGLSDTAVAIGSAPRPCAIRQRKFRN
jgi:hypothetical protein